MAIAYFYVRIIGRGSGGSAVISAAYRHCAKMEYDREARTIDYSKKEGLLHEEFLVPNDAPAWVHDLAAERSVGQVSEAFWNAVENFEKRGDAQLAKDVTIALPLELSKQQHIELIRDFAHHYVLKKGMVADWVYHDGSENPHVHLLMTVRPLAAKGFGPKRVSVVDPDGAKLRGSDGRIVYTHWVGGPDEFRAFRDGWFECLNAHLALAERDIRIDGRSYERQGIELEPAVRVGLSAKTIAEKVQEGKSDDVSPSKYRRIRLQEKRRSDNAKRIERRPEILLDIISRERSVFGEREIAKILHRYVDDGVEFRQLLSRILDSPEALRLERDRIDFSSGARVPAKYTTRELIRLEREMAKRAIWLAGRQTHVVQKEMRDLVLVRHGNLSKEQQAAVDHVTSSGRIASVVGRAGAGKTTMMKAAREIWETVGYEVIGGALAGKAAEGLEREAGIRAGTLSSWERRWSDGRDTLSSNSVFVLDEAGMVSSRQMALLVKAVARAGAKLVLIGDPDQLQPIEAGAAFRAITERIGYRELQNIYRQHEGWMRAASLALSRGKTAEALNAYEAHDRVIRSELKSGAIEHLIEDWSRDYDQGKTSLILAHLRRDVKILNEKARAKLAERGIVGEGCPFSTEQGVRQFATGDHVVFLKNDRTLQVKNGMIGRVLEARFNRIVALVGEGLDRRQVTIESSNYSSVDLGYAVTIHKSQGATVDNVKVLASLSLDQQLTYVAMTRHRDDLTVYYGHRAFEKAGGLVSVLSRSNAKETTLDYAKSAFYRQALRFAENRGLRLMSVARTIMRDRLDWTVRQKQRLSDVAQRLAALEHRLRSWRIGLGNSLVTEDSKPLVGGIKEFTTPFAQAVEGKLAADTALRSQWETVSLRFRLVYAEPQAALKAVEVDAMLKAGGLSKATFTRISNKPQDFGPLNGKSGVFANRVDKQNRERALANAVALASDLDSFLRVRGEAARKCQAEEAELRRRAAIDVPDLSPEARQVLEAALSAFRKNEAQSVLEIAQVNSELSRFSRAVAERFGERTFLGIAARDPNGETFDRVSSQMNLVEKQELRRAWPLLRAIHQLAAYERTSVSMKEAERLRQTSVLRLSLK